MRKTTIGTQIKRKELIELWSKRDFDFLFIDSPAKINQFTVGLKDVFGDEVSGAKYIALYRDEKYRWFKQEKEKK